MPSDEVLAERERWQRAVGIVIEMLGGGDLRGMEANTVIDNVFAMLTGLKGMVSAGREWPMQNNDPEWQAKITRLMKGEDKRRKRAYGERAERDAEAVRCDGESSVDGDEGPQGQEESLLQE